MNVASPGERLLAASLDAGIGLSGTGVVVAVGVFVDLRSPRARRRLHRIRLPSGEPKLGSSLAAGFEPPARWRQALWVVSVAGAVVGRNWRGPGARIVGIRRVDAQTGGPVSVRSAVIRFAAAQGWSRVNAPRQRTASQRLSELGPALKDIAQAHRDDPEAQQRAMADFYRAHRVSPLSSCLWQIPGLAIPSLPALWSPRRQTPFDRLAGILVVSEK